VFGSAHASHWPVHAVSQHTPSTQCPLPHWLAAPHVSPATSSGTQMPPEHQLPLEQSESAVQSPAQAFAPQMYGAHGCVCGTGQRPWPSQPAASVAVPAEHEASRQDVESPGYVQLAVWMPSQLPPHTVPSETHAGRLPCGASVVGVHPPSLPVTSHASHCPLHGELQQNPSAQCPVTH
jgi:hypothetical protein